MHDTPQHPPQQPIDASTDAAQRTAAIIQLSLIEPSPAGPTLGAGAGLGLPGARLKDRMLRRLGGKPVLVHLIDRLRKAIGVGPVAVALSAAPEDDPVVRVAEAGGALVYRGAVHDVVGRIASCVDWLALPPACGVVRVLADSAFVDPRYVEAGVAALLGRPEAGALEFLEDEAEELCPGLSAGFLTAAAVRLINRRARTAVHRADVMSYVYEHPDTVRLLREPLPDELQYLRGNHRLLLQTAEDLALYEAIYLRLYQGVPIDTAAAIGFLNGDPVLASLNRGVLRRGMTLPMPARLGWRSR